jgi:hypothetical protein
MEDKEKLVRRLRLAGRGIGFTMVGFGGIMLIGAAVTEYLKGGFGQPELVGVSLVVIAAVALAGMILTFWRERVGGIILVSMSAALGIHIANFAGSGHAPGLVNGWIAISGGRSAFP